MTDSEDGGGNPFAGGLDVGALMSKAREMQAKMAEAQEAAANVRVEGNAGGGMVVAHANGHGQLLRLEIEQALFDAGDKSMLEDLIVAAVNQAQERGKEVMAGEVSKAAGGLPLPFDVSKLF
ncbi:MAG: DNA-binding YbaB/EbfC family protein [Myxococcota bacterium]|jgi:DNA-binding YbaB/EbfC family protein